MPKYRFVVSDGHREDRTDEIEHPSEAVAVKDPHRALAELVSDLPQGARAEFRVMVEDALGQVLYQAALTFRGGTVGEGKTRRADGKSKP